MYLFAVFLLCQYVTAFKMASFKRFSSSNSLQMLVTKEINMPALSSTMKEGKIVSWNKKVGDKVSAGEVLLVVESDKADMDVESFEDGFLAIIHTPEGGSAAVGAVVAVLVESASDIGKVGSGSPAPATAAPVAATAPAAAAAVTPAASGPKPDFEQIMMPALSSTMKEGKVVSWSKKVGDKISSGDMVLVVESDKADMDVESYEEGFLAVIAVGDGQVAPVGAPVGYLAKSKEDIPSIQAYVASGGSAASAATPAVAASSSAPASTPVSAASVAAPAAIVNDGRVAASGYAQAVAKEQGIDLRTVTPSRPDSYITAKDLATGSSSGEAAVYTPAPGTINATPMARKLAAENNLDVSKIPGTGNFNRVTQEDVLRAAGKLPPPKPVVVAAAPASAATAASASKPAAAAAGDSKVLDGIVPMSGMQKAVAKNMEKTLSVPVFRVSREIVTDKFDALYAQLKPKGVTVSAMLTKAVAEVCKKHPIMNAGYVEGGSTKYNKDVNVAMAVAMDGGLITPTIMKANELDLFSISRNWKELVDKAKNKKLTPAEYSSGTITISNLGMFGVSSFDAILPYGFGCILAISASQPKVVQLPNGHFGVQKAMVVTATCDHRHIYGADVAEFLRDLADLLENNVQSLTMG